MLDFYITPSVLVASAVVQPNTENAHPRWVWQLSVNVLTRVKGGDYMDKVMKWMNNLEIFGSETYSPQKQASK